MEYKRLTIRDNIGCFKYDPKHYEFFDNEAEAEKRLEEIRNETNTL